MPETQGNNKRIAKNTMFLYFRMILIMGVTLYTSRVILDKLGVEDYGLYQVVGGVVGILSFLNGTLSTGTSRFLTYELGAGNKDRLIRTFSTAFYTHAILALFVVVIMETGGLWLLYNKLVIPPDRLEACFWVFQLSTFTTFIAITQVPYTATIMAHERMGIYAYISIFEAFAKLGVCYIISITSLDRLVFYAMLIALVQLSVAMFYRLYSIRKFSESKLTAVFDKTVLKSMMGFSGWNILANISNMLGQQGTLVLINMFFSPIVVAAQAIAGQVSGAMMQFVNNFRTAINPQVIKLYAAGEKDASKKLTLETTIYCFDLILMLGLPAMIVMNKLMSVWLVEVPRYAVVFTQWIIVRQIIGTFSASFYTPMMAANKMKTNSMAAVYLGIGEFVLLYIAFKLGCGPMWIQYLGIFVTIGFSLIVKPWVLIREIDYSLQEIWRCYWSCLKVLALSLLVSLIPAYYLDDSLTFSVLKAIIAGTAVVIASYIFMEKQSKEKLMLFLKSKISNVRNH